MRMSSAARDRGHRLAALAGSFAAALIVTSLALAGFSSGTSATNTIQTKRIFLGSHTAGAHRLSDVSSGTPATKDDPVAYPDGIVDTTGNWASSFSPSRYLQFNLDNPLPAGVAVSNVTFDFRMIPIGATENACYYFEVHRQSDGSLLGTHFSSSSPQCVTGSTYTTISTSLPEVTTSDIADDLYVKVFGKESAAHQFKVDLATLTLTTYGTTETLYADAYTDASSGTGAGGPILGLDLAGDGITYTDASNWPTAYSTTRYLQLGFPATTPAGSMITGVTFDRTWHSGGTQNVCYSIDVFSGSTLIGTHGSGSQISCSNSTAVWNADHTSLPEVTTATDANQIVIRVYEKASAGQKSVDDLDTLTVSYSLD
jgi:hypothetical protein